MRVEVKGEERFDGLLRRVREVCLGGYGHQDVPFEKLVEEMRPERELSHHPLFQVMFALQNVPMSGLELPHLRLSTVKSELKTARFDLSISLGEGGGEITG